MFSKLHLEYRLFPIKNTGIFEILLYYANSFVSLGNGFGRDEYSIFFEKLKLNNANANKWLRLGKCYSTDQKRTYHRNRELKDVSPELFRVILTATSGEFATDGNFYF